jgi:hypothetical protein
LPDNKGLVTDHNEELEAELDILRGEMGTLIKDVRDFIEELKNDKYSDLEQSDIAEILEEIIDGG